MDPLAERRADIYTRLAGRYDDLSKQEIQCLREIIRKHPLAQMAIQAGHNEALVVMAMEHLIRDGAARLHMVEQNDKVLVSILPTRLH